VPLDQDRVAGADNCYLDGRVGERPRHRQLARLTHPLRDGILGCDLEAMSLTWPTTVPLLSIRSP
jgi:hypothetical protein